MGKKDNLKIGTKLKSFENHFTLRSDSSIKKNHSFPPQKKYSTLKRITGEGIKLVPVNLIKVELLKKKIFFIAKHIFALSELGVKNNLKIEKTSKVRRRSMLHAWISWLTHQMQTWGNFFFSRGGKKEKKKMKSFEAILRKGITKPPSEIGTICSLKKIQVEKFTIFGFTWNASFSHTWAYFHNSYPPNFLKITNIQKMRTFIFFWKTTFFDTFL